MEGFGDGRDARAVGASSMESGAADAYRTTPTRTKKPGTLDAPLGDALKSTPKLNVEANEAKWKPLRPPSPVKKAAATASVGDLLSDFASAAPQAAPSASTSATTSRASERSVAREEFVLDGSEEKRAIDKLCTPSGVRLVPAEADVEDFLRTGSRLNAQGVVVALSERLLTYASGEEGWRGAYRAVNVLERAASTSSHRWLADVFANSSAMDLLDAVANDASTHAQLRHKAKACAEALRRQRDARRDARGDARGDDRFTRPARRPLRRAAADGADARVRRPARRSHDRLRVRAAVRALDAAALVRPTDRTDARSRARGAPRRPARRRTRRRLSQTKAFDFVGDLLK